MEEYEGNGAAVWASNTGVAYAVSNFGVDACDFAYGGTMAIQ